VKEAAKVSLSRETRIKFFFSSAAIVLLFLGLIVWIISQPPHSHLLFIVQHGQTYYCEGIKYRGTVCVPVNEKQKQEFSKNGCPLPGCLNAIYRDSRDIRK
jgi:hypothetical protein